MARKPSTNTGDDIDPDAIYRVTLRRRGQIAPGVFIPAGTHEVLGSTLASLGDAVVTKERL